MTELKPCPFCGKDSTEIYRDDSGWWYALCGNCQHEGTPDLGKSGAREAWNTRPIEDAMRAEIERLRAKLQAVASFMDEVEGYSFEVNDDVN